MTGLTLDDLLPLEEYAERRRELLEAHGRYLDRYRRVRIGPRAALLFENRQTLWFRLQEVLRVARLSEPARVRQELEIYNRLLPSRDCLQAALLLAIEDETRLAHELAPWRSCRASTCASTSAPRRIPPTCIPAGRRIAASARRSGCSLSSPPPPARRSPTAADPRS